MVLFCPLASGSKGNSTYLAGKEKRILIDAGIGPRTTAERLGEIGVDLGQIDAILVTHEHTDHIRGLIPLATKLNIPVFANSETAKGIYAALGECPKFKIFATGETFEFGDLQIHPFSIQHDTLDPVAYTVQVGGEKIGICTDLGFVTTLVKAALADCTHLMIEANHEPSMVHASARPTIYKQRVLSRQGHLSNQECANLHSEIAHPNLKTVYLAHLSSECNSPDLALKTANTVLSPSVDLSIAHQHQVSQPIALIAER
jgi:phosphoribosyl 1,2-cyclic phosphodiesterase